MTVLLMERNPLPIWHNRAVQHSRLGAHAFFPLFYTNNITQLSPFTVMSPLLRGAAGVMGTAQEQDCRKASHTTAQG